MGRLRHQRGRPSNYRKSMIKNPYWEKVKRKVRIRDNFKCVLCGCKTKLETHHITYYVDGFSIIGKELNFLKWLVTLCEKHHDLVHKVKNHVFNPNNPQKQNINEYKKQL